MRIILTLIPFIVASILIACGPGVNGGDAEGSRYAGEVIATKGLIFYVRMDENRGAISDYYGRAIGGAEGFPVYSVFGGMMNGGGGPEQQNTAVEFDGATGCFNFGQVDALELQPPFSIVFMSRVNGIGPYTIIGNWGSIGNYEWKLQINATPQPSFAYTNDGTGLNTLTWGSASGAWDHYAITVDATGLARAYQNGGPFGPIGSIPGPIYNHANNNIRVGCVDSGPERMNGAIDELAIFDNQLSDEDIFRMNQARF